VTIGKASGTGQGVRGENPNPDFPKGGLQVFSEKNTTKLPTFEKSSLLEFLIFS
jgi:hypothetical protein